MATATGSGLPNILELITSSLGTATYTLFCLLRHLPTARVSRAYTSSRTMTHFTYFSLRPGSGFKVLHLLLSCVIPTESLGEGY